MNQTNMRLHYIYDPLCGWCYAVAPLVKIASTKLPIHLYGGGLMSGDNRRTINADFKAHVNYHDKNIAQLTGQVFGTDYTDGLLAQIGTVLDSTPPITAIMVADKLTQQGLDMLHLIQGAHYIEGKKVSEFATLQDLAIMLGMDRLIFKSHFEAYLAEQTHAHILATRQLMQRMHAQGFPTLVLEKDNVFTLLNHSQYYGNIEAWERYLDACLTD